MGAVAVFPFPPLVDVTALVVLTRVPGVTPVTFTEKLHEPPAGNVAPVRPIVFDPAVPVSAPGGTQVVADKPFGVDITRPDNVSEKPTPVKATPLGFVSKKLKVVLWPTIMLAKPKDFKIVGGPTTVTVAIAGLPGPPFVEVT